MIDKFDVYYEKGVCVFFFVYKYDNGFLVGDGLCVIIEFGNFVYIGYWLNFM